MALRPVSLRLDAELWDRVSVRARVLGQSRTTFVRRALEQALDGQGEPSRVPSPSPASTRAPEPRPIAFENPQTPPAAVDLPRIARRHWAR